MGKIIYPPDRVQVSGGIIFLAGPIQGTHDWQAEAIENIFKQEPNCNIACPRRSDFKELNLLERHQQYDWETYYLRQAGLFGVVMFWLAKETHHLCRRAFAQTSRFELGEWKMRHEYYKTKLVVGIEPGFSNETYLKHRFNEDCPSLNIHSTLFETCLEAIRQFPIF